MEIYFYPRPPRGGRLRGWRYCAIIRKFLSTPSARRATSQHLPPQVTLWRFLSTPSARRATGWRSGDRDTLIISIHALREEGDSSYKQRGYHGKDFYPRPPRGGRPFSALLVFCLFWISIHALREEGDLTIEQLDQVLIDFYPRPPRGGRP